MDQVKLIDEMRGIDYALGESGKKLLNHYAEKQAELNNLLRNATFDDKNLAKTLKELVDLRLDIAKEVGTYGKLEGQAGVDNPSSMASQVTRARDLLNGPLVDLGDDPAGKNQKRFNAAIRPLLNGDKGLKDRVAQEESASRTAGYAVTNLAANAGKTDTRSVGKIQDDAFKWQVKQAGENAVAQEVAKLKGQYAAFKAPPARPAAPASAPVIFQRLHRRSPSRSPPCRRRCNR